MRPSLRALRSLSFSTLIAAGACGGASDEDIASAEAAKKVKPGSIDPDRRAYLLVTIPSAGAPNADVKIYLGDDLVRPNKPFLVDAKTASRKLSICYDAQRELCDEKTVSLVAKETTNEALQLVSVRVIEATVASLPKPPTPDFGPDGEFEERGTLHLRVGEGYGVSLEQGDPRLLAGVAAALDGSRHLPVLARGASWDDDVKTSGVHERSRSVDGPLLTLVCQAQNAKAEAPTSVDLKRPARENPDAFPHSYKAVLFARSSSPPATDVGSWGPDHDSLLGITVPLLAGPYVVKRAKVVTSQGSKPFRYYGNTVSYSGGAYAVIVNDRMIIPMPLHSDDAPTFRLERIDVDDPIVTDEKTGQKYTVKGEWQLWDDDDHLVYEDTFETGKGVDVLVSAGSDSVRLVPDGTLIGPSFRVKVDFTSRTGPQSQTHEIDF